MGFLDVLFGRTRPVPPDLDNLFAVPAAALTLTAAVGFSPTGVGSVCFSSVEGAEFARITDEVRQVLGADAGRTGPPVESERDSFGYSWLVSRRSPEELPDLVGDLHAVNSTLQDSGFGPQLLCSLVGFREPGGRSLALVYLFKRGTFYPFAPLSGERRDNALELQVRAALTDDLRIETDLSRWFALWGAPGL
ncbi:PspA-associated protein PspAB [Streptomyces sp. NPDC002454]